MIHFLIVHIFKFIDRSASFFEVLPLKGEHTHTHTNKNTFSAFTPQALTYSLLGEGHLKCTVDTAHFEGEKKGSSAKALCFYIIDMPRGHLANVTWFRE